MPPAIATKKMIARYQACHSVAEPAAEQADAVDGGGDDDHARQPEAVAERPGHERRDDVPAGDGGEHVLDVRATRRGRP